MPTELGYVTIPVASVPRAAVFYGALFGWSVVGDLASGGAHVSNTRLPVGFTTGEPARYAGLYFAVDDLEGAMAKVVDLGGHVGAVTESQAGQMAGCEDDQGTLFSLWRPSPGFGPQEA